MICSICKVDRAEVEFYASNDLRRSWCKSCDRYRDVKSAYRLKELSQAHEIVNSCAYCEQAAQVLNKLINSEKRRR